MYRCRLFLLVFFVSFFSSKILAQTVLRPGDIGIVSMASDMGACGLPAQADEINFFCYQDITNGTIIDLTDNGWEHAFANFWGDSEGTLRMTRTGGTIPRGTVITLQAQIIAGNWTYRTISPDNQWNITNINVPGGPFNLDNGGDQIYFMQGGTWNNQGGGGNRALYDGRLIFAANNHYAWAANGTVNESNLHPDVLPCYYMHPSDGLTNVDFLEYVGPLDETNHFNWLQRIQDFGSWTTYGTCGDFQSNAPNFIGATIPIEDVNFFIMCPFACSGCSPFETQISFSLPEDGTYNVTWTDGTDTFEIFDIPNFWTIPITVNDTTTFSLISVEEVDGCTIYSNFDAGTTVSAAYKDAGEYNEYIVCPSFNMSLQLINLLNGTPEPGGFWRREDGLILQGGTWLPFLGPGLYTYFLEYDPSAGCMPNFDTASVRITLVDASATTIEVGCSQSGTPNNIFDDAIEITMNFQATGFGANYFVSVSSGSITPTEAVTGVPTVFTLSPGTAMGPNLTLNVFGLQAPWCEFHFPIVAPGFCSDPCDYEMTSSVFGDDEICVNSCPEEPITLNVDVQGGTPPYKMDFSIEGPNQLVWNFPNIPIEAFQELVICIDNVPAPVYNANTGFLILPASLAGSGATFNLVNVYDKYDCTSILEIPDHFINIYPLPMLTPDSLTFCSDEAVHVNLTDYEVDISPFFDITWFDGNPFGAGEQIANPTQVNLENVVDLWARIYDDFCYNAIRIPFTILPKPDLDSIPPIRICQGSSIALNTIPIVDAANSMATYTFHAGLPPDSTNILDPAFYLPSDSTTIYVLATAAICYDTLPIQIFVEDYPDFTLEALPCDLIQGTYSVLFTTSADSIAASAGVVVNNPSGQDVVTGIPNNTNITIEVLNPTGLCKDTFAITAPNCNCPIINQPFAAITDFQICEDEVVPVMSVTVGGGLVANWFDVPSGGTAILQNSLSFQPPGATSATYYVEALDPSNGCYSIRTPISLTVNPLPILQALADIEGCDPVSIDFNTLAPSVLNGVNGTGSWFNLITNLPVSGILQPQSGDAWYYLFSSNPGNCNASDTIAAVVHPLPSIDLYNVLCDDATLTYQLLFTSDADIVLAGPGNLVQIPGTDSFALQDIPFDTDVQIDLQYTATGCSSSILQLAPDCSCPQLLQNNNLAVCSDLATVDLSSFQGPGVNGTWQLVSTPGGGNPASLTGSDLQISNADPGAYTLRFIRSVILADCIDSALFQLQLNTSPFADAGVNATVCAPDVITLAGNAGGTNVQFNWQTNGGGAITNPNSLNTTYTPTLTDISAGILSFTLTAVDPSGACPNASETINITIDGRAYYILDPGTQTYCDTSDILVDLDNLISFGTTGGEWFFPDTVSAPVIGSSQINPSTIPEGNYTIFYTSTNAVAPCQNDTTAVNLIIENCECPSVAISNPSNALCSESDALNLNTLVITTEPGTWSIINTPPGIKPAVINGSQFVTNLSDDGFYRLRFSLTNPVSGCPGFSDITLEVIETPVLSLISSACADDLQSWEAVISSSSAALISSPGNIVPLGNNQYRIENITLLTALQVSASNGNGLCSVSLNIPNPDCECTLSISNLPDEVTLCPNETIVLEAQVNDPKGAVTSFWIVANDSLYQNTLEVGQAGSYQFVTQDELGCKEQHTVDVLFYQEMAPSVTWVDINCPGDQNGQIILQDIQGGNAPFFISINGGNLQPVNTFPHIISGLGGGTYMITLQDGFSCTTDFEVDIQSASSETLSLGPDQTILVGDSVLINALISFSPDSFYWIGNVDNLLDPDLLNQWIKPENDQAFQLFVIDEKGCLYSDDIKIRVLLTSSIYVPNIFSPNGDGINDILEPLTDPSITLINYFEIYSRWGELVYSMHDMLPNLGNFGWDGTMGKEKMMPGVFVYRLGAVNKRGVTIMKQGDITLIR
jgi:gliding motility-associated-like protein